MITGEDHVPQLRVPRSPRRKWWNPLLGFAEGAPLAPAALARKELLAPAVREPRGLVRGSRFFSSSQEMTSVPQGRGSRPQQLHLSRHRRAERIGGMKGTRHPRDRQRGQQGLSGSGSSRLFDILQTSSAGKAPAHSSETRLLLKRWLWILNYTGLDLKHYIGGNKVMRALLMSLKLPLWKDVESGLCMEIQFKLIPSIH